MRGLAGAWRWTRGGGARPRARRLIFGPAERVGDATVVPVWEAPEAPGAIPARRHGRIVLRAGQGDFEPAGPSLPARAIGAAALIGPIALLVARRARSRRP